MEPSRSEPVDLSDAEHAALDAYLHIVLHERVLPPPRTLATGTHSLVTILNGSSVAYQEIDWPILEKYTKEAACMALLQDPTSEVWDLLEKRDFRTIRRMAQFHVRPAPPDNDFFVSRYSGTTATLKAWNKAYVGNIKKFIDYIMLFLDKAKTNPLIGKHDVQIYAHYVAFSNSTGTGKSRASDQLSTIRFLIPICFRHPLETGFPPTDLVVREYFLTHDDDPDAAFRAYLAFLTACFEEAWYMIDAGVGGLSRHNTYAQNCERFHKWIGEGQEIQKTGENRTAFYARVIEKAKKYEMCTEAPDFGPLDEQTNTSIEEWTLKLGPDNMDKRERWRLKQVIVAFETLCTILKTEGHPDNKYEPLVYVSFDEAHVLTPQMKGSRWTMFSQLRRALRVLNEQRIFSLFLSTTGSIYQFNPDPRDDVSKRLQDGRFSLIPPYTNFGFDHMAVICRLDDEPSIDDIAKISRLVRLGRPLFGAHYDSGEFDLKSHILEFAAEKLICGSWPGVDELNEEQKLACLSTRLALHFTPVAEARKEAAIQVERHMRLCLASEDPTHGLVTIAGSEPIVAEAAKEIMKGLSHNFDPAATLARRLQGPIISRGDRGELVVELLLLRAYDEAANKLGATNQRAIQKNAAEASRSIPAGASEQTMASHASSAQPPMKTSQSRPITSIDNVTNAGVSISEQPEGRGEEVNAEALDASATSSSLPRDSLNTVDSTSSADHILKAETKGASSKFPKVEPKHDETLPIVPLVDFLEALFPEMKWANAKPTVVLGDNDEENERCTSQSDVPLAEAFRDTYVFFNHFIQFRSRDMLNRKYLHALILRCAAGICAPGQDAIDVIIPYLIGRILKVEKIGCIVVQVKLDKKLNRLEIRLFDDIDPFSLRIFASNCDHTTVPPIIRIVFSLGSEDAYMWPGPFDADESEYERRYGAKHKMYLDSDGESENAPWRKKQRRDNPMPAPQAVWREDEVVRDTDAAMSCDNTSSSIPDAPLTTQAHGETAARKAHGRVEASTSRQTRSSTRKQQEALQDTHPVASERARKTQKRTGDIATPLAGPSNRTEDDFGVAEEQTGRNDKGADTVRSTRSKAGHASTAAAAPRQPRKGRGRGAATRTKTALGNSRPSEPNQAKPPTNSPKKTRSRKARSGRAFLAYDLWCAGLHPRNIGPAHPRQSWKELLQASYISWNEIHARKAFYDSELDSRSEDTTSLPDPQHTLRFDEVAAYRPDS